MLVASLWSHWKDGEEELDSFAAITDEPPAEVAAAGHDRCIVPIKGEHLMRSSVQTRRAWRLSTRYSTTARDHPTSKWRLD